MTKTRNDPSRTFPWKLFVITTIESLLGFYLATFCVAMYFLHRSGNWIPAFILLILLYVFVIVVVSKRVFEKLSMATIMLLIPIAPFIALLTVITLIPVIQLFK